MSKCRRVCAYCHAPADSRDHIIPREWGGMDTLWWDESGEVRNVKPACVKCNQLRARCGHCVGAMAAVRRLPPYRLDAAVATTDKMRAAIPRPRWLWWEK